jgi:uncharacterized protein (TIGR04222 family)
LARRAAALDNLAQDQNRYPIMPLNPLDWTAQPFLTLYVAVAAAAVLLVLVLRRSAGTGPDPMGSANADPVMLAWLTGGPRRAADMVLVAFLESGVADQFGLRGQLSIDMAQGTVPSGLRRFGEPANNPRSVTAFRRAIQPGLEEVRDNLVQRGLAPAREVIERWW